MKKQNNLAIHYYFEILLVSGYPAGRINPEIERGESPLYAFGEELTELELWVSKPSAHIPWMLLKVSCLESDGMEAHPKHYAMRVGGRVVMKTRMQIG